MPKLITIKNPNIEIELDRGRRWDYVTKLARKMHERGWGVWFNDYDDGLGCFTLTKMFTDEGGFMPDRPFKARILVPSDGLTALPEEWTNWVEITDTTICMYFEHFLEDVPQEYIDATQEIFDAADEVGNMNLCGVATDAFATWWQEKFDRIGVLDERENTTYPFVIYRSAKHEEDSDES